MKAARGVLFLSAVFVAGAAIGADDRFGVGLKFSTLGVGVEFTGAVNSWCSLRASLNQYDYSRTFDKEGITYDGTLEAGGYGVLADFFPSRSQFRLTAGLLKNRNKLGMISTPTSNIDIGDGSYTPAQIGTLTGDMSFRSTVSYFGIGYGNAPRSKHRVGFVFDLGVEPQGSPKTTLSASGGGVSESDLQKEAAQIDEDTKNFKLWPVIAFGISFRI